MADTPKITFEVYRGDELVQQVEYQEQSITIGSGAAAMLSVEDESLAELHAVINVEPDGQLQVLDLGSEAGTRLNGEAIANAPISSGDALECGALRIVVRLGEAPVEAEAAPVAAAPVEAAAEAEAAAEVTEVTEVSEAEDIAATNEIPSGAPEAVHAVADLPEDDDDTDVREDEEDRSSAHFHGEDDGEEAPTEDVMAFIMRSDTSPSDVGLDRKKPNVLEVNQVWGDHLLDTRHYNRGSKPVSVGSSVGWRWSFLGVNIGWVPTPLNMVLPWLPPMWSEVNGDWRNDFYAPDTNLPNGRDHNLLRWQGATPVASIASNWDGFVDVGDQRYSFSEAIDAGKATRSGNEIEVPIDDDTRLMVDIDGIVFFVHQVAAGKRVVAGMSDGIDYPFLGIFGFVGFIGLMFGLLMFTLPPPPLNAMVEIPDRFVELLLEKPEIEKDKGKKPDANPDAGEGAKAKREEGKVGKKDAKMEKAKGNKVEIRKQEMDRQIAENAGVLGALRDGAELDGVFGTSGLSSDIAGGIGGLIGAKGTQIGSGGLGSRGSGLGGGGTAEGLGGLGTKGIGSGASGFGSGGGNFGAKGDGAISAVGGDPIILGALDKALIDEVVKRHMNQIKYCYQRELNKNPSLSGKIVIKFVIAKDGSVSSASTKTTTMGNAAVENCVAGRFLRMQFPQPKGGGIVIVSYPFVFGT